MMSFSSKLREQLDFLGFKLRNSTIAKFCQPSTRHPARAALAKQRNSLFSRNGSSIKDVRTQGKERFVQCGNFADKEGFLQMRMSHFLAKKTSDFSKFMVCPHGQEGLSQCRQGGRRVNFLLASFMDGP